mmetsp:Transcript_70843/g.196815  ORF Transcript_70843/g.196815 Transcript_70843/m.196815 type:complete len:263 (-) Transcript_70843:119-907(-)
MLPDPDAAATAVSLAKPLVGAEAAAKRDTAEPPVTVIHDGPVDVRATDTLTPTESKTGDVPASGPVPVSTLRVGASDAEAQASASADNQYQFLDDAAKWFGLDQHRETYQRYVSMVQPWSDFFRLSLPRDCNELRSRIRPNFLAYRANYAVCALVLLSLAMAMLPLHLLVVSLLAILWRIVLKRRQADPGLKVACFLEVQGRRLPAALLVVTVLAFGLFVAPVVVGIAVPCCTLVLAHASLHPGMPGSVGAAREVAVHGAGP